MSAAERNLATFTLEDNVYELSNGLVPRIAEAVGYQLTDTPDAENIGGLIGAVAPDKELQSNIPHVSGLLKDNIELAAGWVEESGILRPQERTFATNAPAAETTDAILVTGGIARWPLRRVSVILGLDPEKHGGEVVGAFGERLVQPGEHQLAATYARQNGRPATEAEFAERFLRPMLENAGYKFDLIAPPTKDGDEVADALFNHRPDLLGKKVLIACNAPSADQTAGAVRAAGLRIDPSYDSDGKQISFKSDTIGGAYFGEKPETHQNFFTGLAQIPRNIIYIVRNQIALN